MLFFCLFCFYSSSFIPLFWIFFFIIIFLLFNFRPILFSKISLKHSILLFSAHFSLFHFHPHSLIFFLSLLSYFSLILSIIFVCLFCPHFSYSPSFHCLHYHWNKLCFIHLDLHILHHCNPYCCCYCCYCH